MDGVPLYAHEVAHQGGHHEHQDRQEPRLVLREGVQGHEDVADYHVVQDARSYFAEVRLYRIEQPSRETHQQLPPLDLGVLFLLCVLWRFRLRRLQSLAFSHL